MRYGEEGETACRFVSKEHEKTIFKIQTFSENLLRTFSQEV